MLPANNTSSLDDFPCLPASVTRRRGKFGHWQQELTRDLRGGGLLQPDLPPARRRLSVAPARVAAVGGSFNYAKRHEGGGFFGQGLSSALELAAWCLKRRPIGDERSGQ